MSPSRSARGVLVAIALLATTRTGTAALPGELDPGFNGGQAVQLDLARTVPRTTTFSDVTIDAGGSIMLSGVSSDENGRIAAALARLTPLGALDPSFGSGGSLVVQLGLGASGILSAPNSVAARPGGGWLVMGQATASDGRRAILVAAFDDDGMPDLGYGSGGSVRVQAADPSPAETHGRRGAIDADGSAFVTGLLDESGMWAALAKVTPAGSVAVGFGNRPAVGTYANIFDQTPPARSEANDVVVTPAGIVVAGRTNDPAGMLQQLLFRLLPTGARDTTFAIGIVQAADPGAMTRSSVANAVAVGPDGEIYVAGEAADGDSRMAVAVTRFTPAGALDETFASGGTRRVQTASGASASSSARDVVVQADGKVLLIGSSSVGTLSELIVLRLETDGDLDPTFGAGGLVRMQVASSTIGHQGALSPDGRSLVVVGASIDGAITSGFVVRVLLTEVTTSQCPPGPSITGARCRLTLLTGAVEGEVPEGKLRSRLSRALGRGATRLAAAENLSERALRRKLRKVLAQMRQVRRMLGSKAAGRALAEDRRAALIADGDALLSELDALRAAS